MPSSFGGKLGRGIGELSAGRPRRSGDRVDRGRPFVGGVYPRKGKGWGVQGEAAYPDLLDQLDRRSQWQSWRKGMALARSQLVGAAERWSAVEVMHRATFTTSLRWRRSRLLLAGFTSPQSPEGRWTVAVQPRGTEIAPRPVGTEQDEVWDPLGVAGDPVRLLRVTSPAAAAPIDEPEGEVARLEINRMLIGEVVEDSAIDATTLAEDPEDGIGLLCVGVHERSQTAFFDATRYWKRMRGPDGRLRLREFPVAAWEPLPTFRSERHLTQALTLSCNCPSYIGMEFAALRQGPQLGGQQLFPQRAPGGLEAPLLEGLDESNTEGVRRLFLPLSWARLPGVECKHCHAVRWAMGVPMAEPADMPSPDSDYWRDLAVMAELEEAVGPMSGERFLDRLRTNLLDEQQLSSLDLTLLATCTGDCVGIAPQRVRLDRLQLGEELLPESALGVLRINEQYPTEDYRQNEEAVFGDWWVGRGTETVVLGFSGPAEVESSGPAITPLDPQGDLPSTLP